MEERYDIEEQEIDISKLISKLWGKRRLIIIITSCFILLGLLAALATEHKYTSKIAFVPQFNSSMNSKLSSLASLAGVSLDEGMNDGPISPVVYPMIMNNLDMLKELVHTPIHFKGYTEPIELVDYFTDPQYKKKSAIKTIVKYTIGLPGVIMGALTPEIDTEGISESAQALDVPVLTKEETDAIKILKKCVKMEVMKTERHIVLEATMNEAVASTEVVNATYGLFKKYISEFKVKKAKSNLDFLEKQHAEAKANYERLQTAYARYKDSNRGKKSAAAEVELDRMKSETELARVLYVELAKQCLTGRVKVTEENVAFTELSPAYVPFKSANSRKTVLIVWTFFGFIVACATALVVPMFKKEEEVDNQK